LGLSNGGGDWKISRRTNLPEVSRPQKGGTEYCRSLSKTLQKWVLTWPNHQDPQQEKKQSLKNASGIPKKISCGRAGRGGGEKQPGGGKTEALIGRGERKSTSGLRCIVRNRRFLKICTDPKEEGELIVWGSVSNVQGGGR